MKRKTLLWLALSAVLWVAVGAAIGEVAHRKSRVETPEEERLRIEEALEQLGLNAEQRSRIGQILSDHQFKVRDQYQAFRKQLAGIEQDADTAIQEVLTPVQMDRYRDEILGHRSH